MNSIRLIVLLSFFLLINSCVTLFIPEISESQDLLVVEGMITDQPEVNTIKLSRSMPLGKRTDAIPLPGCSVMIEDDLGTTYYLNESEPGVYVTDPSEFTGVVGRFYKLKIFTNGFSDNFLFESIPTYFSYESLPMEMKPVPPIDSLFYEKVVIEEESEGRILKEGCQIYLSSYDPTDKCEYYKYDYIETWKIRLPYDIVNRICWVSSDTNKIILKNTSVLSENRISRFPLQLISNETDRLAIKYSMLVNQYSLNKDEYIYWEKIQTVTQDVGNLYDIIPSSFPGNIYCNEDPERMVLGFFSVSSKASKRIFIDESFSGIYHAYSNAICQPFGGSRPEAMFGLGESVWLIIDGSTIRPPFMLYTHNHSCADCTTRGTNIEPLFWKEDY
jgi:Domain of unknown function (DUF4249)